MLINREVVRLEQRTESFSGDALLPARGHVCCMYVSAYARVLTAIAVPDGTYGSQL